jgi:hypothetical protein
MSIGLMSSSAELQSVAQSSDVVKESIRGLDYPFFIFSLSSTTIIIIIITHLSE